MVRFLCLVVALTACSAPPPPKKAPEKPLLRLGGSETVTTALLPALTAAHEKSRGTYRFEVTGGGTGTGIRQLLSGRLDIAAATREHRPSDEEQAKANGFSLEERGAKHVIGLDVIALSVNQDSPLESLTYDQVIGIFCTGSIDDLKFLHPEREGPIRPLTRELGSGTRALFEDFFCGPSGIHRDVESADAEAIRKALTEDATAISYGTMTEDAGKTLSIRANLQIPPVEPSQKNIANGSYPLYRDLYLYTAGPASGNAGKFIDWVLSPAGQEVVDEHFFVPIYHRTAVFDGPRPLRETVHFDAGKTQPNQRSLARIQLLVQELQQRKGTGQHIVLEGFTDDREQEQMRLSTERAETVKHILEQQLEGTYFEIIPRGDIRPLAPNNTPFGRTRNRRVQIYLADEEEAADLVVTPE